MLANLMKVLCNYTVLSTKPFMRRSYINLTLTIHSPVRVRIYMIHDTCIRWLDVKMMIRIYS